jgi:hypothetical protein
MNLDVDQHETYIAAQDDSSKIVQEAISPPAQPKVVIPVPTDEASGARLGGTRTKRSRTNFCGLRLAWRGLYLLGVALGVAGAWFITAWIRHGRIPLSQPQIILSISTPPDRILPPEWLVAAVGLLAVVSLCMMLLGTHDVIPKLTFKKNGEPDRFADD